MKAHYINILLFALPLNILEHNQRNHNSTTLHTPITRLLCECELYEPSNYDNDPQMKKVMENFNRQTSQRFHEYDNRMVEKRQKCKDKCDKEIQKIILKDKLEKELMDKLAALETDIQNDAIPTCVCEKSLVDKTEKFCLNCGKNMGAIAPWWGLVCGVGYAGWLHAATAAAIELATKKGIEEGVKVVIAKITNSLFGMLPNVQWSNFINGSNYNSIPGLVKVVTNAMNSSGKTCINSNSDPMCIALPNLKTTVVQYVTAAEGAAAAKTESVKAIEVGKVTTQSTQLYTGIGYCVLAILIIILIMVITYLILRHRRKKKMKKKLQYIKLLEE
ncbi:rifin PIR protein, putative [Plasmodium reichenowi]|uniref:Rifin PIR protein, putative n=1 Tax=Plasmodium reichenowi TaxID=5854 RepID=A0A2P9DCF3_PLARE|nr:rifin PIR protein, putative [Plasmodium reichenowi]